MKFLLPGRRIHVVGTAGSGKTTVARHLSQLLDIPHLELDRVYWGPGLVPVDQAKLKTTIQGWVARDAWIVDGNYRHLTYELVWTRADTLIWLDLPRYVLVGRLLFRTLSRRLREVEWSAGNPESVRRIVQWAWSTHARRKAEYERATDASSMNVIRLCSASDVTRWLDQVRSSIEARDEA